MVEENKEIISTPNANLSEEKIEKSLNTSINKEQGDKFNLQQQTDSNTKEIERLRAELSNERFNNLTIFGIFASLVTFFSIEIQVFKNIENFWFIIGLTSFLVSSMLLFVFSLHLIAREKMSWKNFFGTPIFYIFLLFLIFSFSIFLLNAKGINIDLQIKSNEQVTQNQTE